MNWLELKASGWVPICFTHFYSLREPALLGAYSSQGKSRKKATLTHAGTFKLCSHQTTLITINKANNKVKPESTDKEVCSAPKTRLKCENICYTTRHYISVCIPIFVVEANNHNR